jgi:endonuclease/exonuclease/phosphatase family metal-dependent hydrolase
MDWRSVRMLTLNCWNVSEPFAERMALVREGITRLAPDLVALQEIVVRGDGLDQGALALEGLGYQHVFGASYPFDDGGGFGNLVAARWPISAHAVQPLPVAEGDTARSAIVALVETPGGALPVVSTHLEWRFDKGYVRERQALAVAILVAEWSRRAALPPILAGDFNAEPDATEMRFLRGLASLDGQSVYFQDAWEVAGDGGRGFTWDNRNCFAAANFEPSRRIDYILVGLADRQGRGVIEAARVVFDQPRETVFPSDHFGLVADVRLLP